MTKRERKYHFNKKVQKALVNALRESIREAFDNEIIRVLKAMAEGETNVESDLIPFGIKY